LFFMQTDNAPYWKYLQAILPSFFDFNIQEGPWPETPRGRTRREILALRRRYPIYRGWGVRKAIPGDEALAASHDLPLPDFDAGPRRKDLDQLEEER
jgi:tRNA (guanine-N7-)-methyltransferase